MGRSDQDVAGDGIAPHGDSEPGREDDGPVSAAVEAEDDLVEIALKMLSAQAVMEGKRPAFEVAEEAMYLREHDMSRPWGQCGGNRGTPRTPRHSWQSRRS